MFIKIQSGQGLVEYALILVLVAIVVVATIMIFGNIWSILGWFLVRLPFFAIGAGIILYFYLQVVKKQPEESEIKETPAKVREAPAKKKKSKKTENK